MAFSIYKCTTCISVLQQINDVSSAYNARLSHCNNKKRIELTRLKLINLIINILPNVSQLSLNNFYYIYFVFDIFKCLFTCLFVYLIYRCVEIRKTFWVYYLSWVLFYLSIMKCICYLFTNYCYINLPFMFINLQHQTTSFSVNERSQLTVIL